ncbi:uncharacterized protein YlxW (UPF0749 family) [Stackebrandtia albiflava]|uniref:Uncharacterized protein YlxW (UPF0749 family) n=1 Tax=Stackebrandtia albiflava TaxID=406432 RepID=A0A562VD98_9ACTN|nr:DUF881 domain-containing protein [Stackebrandtia albiflava]TWJ15850.1 uncharacterized protein YlxW (UPF0749 family) [Stackebrandtia albiflava]
MTGRGRFGLPSVDLLAQFWNEPLDYEVAPEGRRPGRTVTGRTLSVAVLVVIGLLLAVAYRETVSSQPADAEARQELRDDIAAQRDDNDRLLGQVEALQEEVNGLRDDLIGGRGEVEQLHRREAMAGLRAVTGDGARLVVADGPAPEDPDAADLGEVFDRDLHLIVNTLWAFGAEAVAVDGRRLTATSAIRAAGDAILVDFAPVSSPYEITAIGPDDLADDFNASATAEAFAQYAADYGISLSVEPAEGLSLPAAPVPPLDNATPKEPN